MKKNNLDNTYQLFKCDVCESSQAVEVPFARIYTKDQPIHICKNCGFIYVKKRRPFNVVAQVWSTQLFGKSYTSKSPLMLARHFYIAEFIHQYLRLKGKHVIDVGAGEGQFLNIIKKNYGGEAFGIEPSVHNCKILDKLKVPSFQGTLEDYIQDGGQKKRSADIVTLMWTLENATQPKEVLTGIHKILSSNGHIVVATGSRILVPFSKPLNLYLSSNPADTHPSRFSINTLSSLLGVCGFRVVHVNPYLNDALTLCVIAKKEKGKLKIKGDDYRSVVAFFKKWHHETASLTHYHNG